MSAASMLRLGLLSLLWGSNFLLIAVALEGFAPLQVLVGRLLLGALALVVILRLSGLRLPTGRSTWWHLTVAAVLGNVIPYYLFAWAQQTVASSLAGVLNATTPLFTLLLAAAARQERRIGADRALGLCIGFAGVVLIMAPWQAANLDAGPGQVGVLAASACYGITFVYQRRHLTGRGTPPVALAAGQLVAASAVALLAAPALLRAPAAWSLPAVASLVALGALGTGLAYAINFRLVQDEGATNASTVTYLLPIVAGVLGAVALAEPITPRMVAGTAVVFVGIALAQRRLPVRGRRRAAPPPSPAQPLASDRARRHP